MIIMNGKEYASAHRTNQTTSQQPHSCDTPSAGQARGTPEDEAAVLETLRELLFGDQVRTTDRRFEQLEQRSLDETTRRSQAVSDRMDALERQFAEQLDQLASQVSQLEAEMRKNTELISLRAEALRHAFNERFTQEIGSLEKRIGEEQERATARAERAAVALEENKMNRADLAALLGEMASRVGGE